MASIKLIHVICAYATGLGFLLRGLLSIAQHPVLDHPLCKRLPHIIDTCLLIAGLTMVVTLSLWPSEQPWLTAKLIALLLYIACGLLMLRWAKTTGTRVIGLISGLCVFIYIVGAAYSKSPISVFALLPL